MGYAPYTKSVLTSVAVKFTDSDCSIQLVYIVTVRYFVLCDISKDFVYGIHTACS